MFFATINLMDYYKQTPGEVMRKLSTSEYGLSDSEVKNRLKKYGPNTISVKQRSFWLKLIEPFRSVFMVVLFVAAGLSFMHGAALDGIIVIAIILVSAFVYYAQTYSTERILKSLRKHTKQSVLVIRHGKEFLVDSTQIVPGDIIILEEGDKVPVDGRVVESKSLRVDESQLTGESLPISKKTERITGNKAIYEQNNMVFQGSFAVGGSAKIIAVTTGNETEFGKIATLSTEERSESPVQKKIDKLITWVIVAVSVASIAAFALAIYRGMEISEALRFVIALAVSAVPEGLPVAISIILAIGMSRMAARKALVRNMSAIESIGIVTTIATDKTGTLTKNRLSVVDVWVSEGGKTKANRTLALSALQIDAKIHDPLDQAFVDYGNKQKLLNSNRQPVEVYKFEHSVAMSGNLWHNGSDYIMYIKGAPEAIIRRSDLTENEREKITHQMNYMASRGYRVIALAHTNLKTVPDNLSKITKNAELDFDGLAMVADIVRPEARAAIRTAKRAGIVVRMITGDHYETAFNIGNELGLVDDRSQVFDSRAMDKMSDDELEKIIDKIRVFSRVIPEQKHRLLTILKRNNITAMTGDGVNDIPALTNAHVGLAMGSGVEVAKDAADIVLLDDNFRSIINAVHEGRTIFSNIKRMVVYLLSTNLGEVLISMGALLAGAPLPLVPVQLLWVNLVTDTCMVIPIGMEPGEKRNMKRPPQKPGAGLLSKFMISRIIIIAATMSAVVLWLYFEYLGKHGLDYARTIAFSSMVVMQWASAFSVRSDYEPLYLRIFRWNPAFIIGLAVGIVLQALVIFGPLGSLLHVSHVAIADLALTAIISFVVVIAVIETHKWIGRRFFNKGSKTYRKLFKR